MNADDAPRRLIVDDAVGHQHADAVDREVAQADVLEKLAERAEQESPSTIGSSYRAISIEPVIPRLLVTVALAAGLEPGVERFVETLYSRPVEEGAGIKEDDRGQADRRDHRADRHKSTFAGAGRTFGSRD